MKKTGEHLTLRNPWLWVVVGIVALVAMFVLTGVLSKPAPRPARTLVLDPKKEDLVAFTRMLDTVGLEPALLSGLGPDRLAGLARVDSLIATGSVQDAFARLDKLVRRADTASRQLLHAFTGLCHSRLRDHSQAAVAFEAALAWPDSSRPLLLAQLCFDLGSLFLRFGEPESARHYYAKSAGQLARVLAGTDSVSPGFRPALLNNLGVACETVGDTAAARRYYVEAAALIDTLDTGRDARRVRENVARVGQNAPARAGPARAAPTPN